MHYSDIIRTAREKADISRRKVAKQAKLSESHLRFIEKGERPSKLDTLRRLAMIIGIDDKKICEAWLQENMPAVNYNDIKDKLPKGISIEELAAIHNIQAAEQTFQEAEEITAGNFNSMSPQQFFKIRDSFQNCLRFIKELELNTQKTA